MKPQYVPLVGTTPKIVLLNTNSVPFLVQVRVPAGATLEVCLENPVDAVAPNTYTPPVTTQTPVWFAAPTAVGNVTTLRDVVAAIRITPTGDGIATVLQQGII